MTIIYAARHAEYENPEGIMPFRMSGFPLTENGRMQAKRLALYLKNKKISAVYSSPQLRTRQTAEIIAAECGLKVEISELINETKSPLQGRHLTEYRGSPFIYEGREKGETPEEIFQRMSAFVRETLQKHPDESIVLVSHGDPIGILKEGLSENSLDSWALRSEDDIIGKGDAYEFVFGGENLERTEKLGIR